MFCFNCGSQIPDNSVFCPECGAKVAAGAAQKEAPEQKPAETVKDKSPVGNPTPKPQENSPQKGKGKKKRIIAIVAALFILIAAGGVFAYFHFNDSPTVGNTNSNLMNGGCVTTKNDTVYYVKFVDSYYKTELKSMDSNGGNVKTLYSFDGEIFGLNIDGDNIYFVGNTCDDNGNLLRSNIYLFDLKDSSVKTLFDPEDIGFTSHSESTEDDGSLINPFVENIFIENGKIFFDFISYSTSYNDDFSGIYSMNLDGSDLTSIIKRDNRCMSGLSVADSYLFYQYNETFYRCDLDGSNKKKIYDRAEYLYGLCCINDGKIYLCDNNDDVFTIVSMDLGGGDSEEIARFEEDINSINVVGDKIYYSLKNYDTNTAQICSMNLDGSDQKVLKTSDKGYYLGINVYGHWLYYAVIDDDSPTTSSGKLDLNDVTE